MAPYKKRVYFRRGNRDKYSVEQSSFVITLGAGGQEGRVVVPGVDFQGMRKIKHLTVSLASVGDTVGSVYWALVYVPAGTSAGTITTSATAAVPLYEPNQFVMNCGVMDFSAGPVRITSPVSRNLNSGDNVALILASTTSNNFSVNGVVRYAVTLQ